MSKYTFYYIFIAIVSGVSLQLNWISNASISSNINSTEIILRILFAPIPVWILMKFIDYIINTIVKNNVNIERKMAKNGWTALHYAAQFNSTMDIMHIRKIH